MMCSAPKIWSVRYTADSTFCASTVASSVIGGASQLSQWPQSPASVLAEAGEQRARAAGHRLGQRDDLFQLGAHHPLLRVGRGGLRQPVPRLRDVLAAEQQQRFGRVAVAAGAADLLVPGLGTVGHVQMHDEAHVRPVDAHAEGDRCHHDQRLAGAEPRQRLALLFRIQPGVEGNAGNPFSPSFAATRSVLAREPQ